MERHYGETLVTVPARPVLALEGARPNPPVSELFAAFTLVDPGTARIAPLGSSWRQVRAWQLSGLEAGQYMHRLKGTTDLAPGVYLLRLAFEKAVLVRRVIVLT